jgi:hypothetical protein
MNLWDHRLYIADAAIGSSTGVGSAVGCGAGVTGPQFCNDFNVSWNVSQAVTGYKAASPSRNRAGAVANQRTLSRVDMAFRAPKSVSVP